MNKSNSLNFQNETKTMAYFPLFETTDPFMTTVGFYIPGETYSPLIRRNQPYLDKSDIFSVKKTDPPGLHRGSEKG